MSSFSQSLEVITVLGPIAPEEMGVTQTHEHLLFDGLDHYGSYEFVIDDEETVVAELGEFSRRGGKTICDCTTEEIGRNPRGLSRISAESKVHVLMGAGWYREPEYPRVVQERTSSELAALLVREIEEGVEGTGIRAGFIGEIGTGRRHIRPAEDSVSRCSFPAQRDNPSRPSGSAILGSAT